MQTESCYHPLVGCVNLQAIKMGTWRPSWSTHSKCIDFLESVFSAGLIFAFIQRLQLFLPLHCSQLLLFKSISCILINCLNPFLEQGRVLGPVWSLKIILGTSLVVQWLILYISNAEGSGLIPGWGAKIPHVARCCQKEKAMILPTIFSAASACCLKYVNE